MILAFWHKTERWHRLIPGKYCHVSVLVESNDALIHIDLGPNEAEIQADWFLDNAPMFDNLHKHTDLIRCPDVPRKSAFFRPLTCVSFAKHCAGLRSRALFPGRLANDLLRNGGEMIHEAQDSPGIQ